MELTYRTEGDYRLPNLEAPEAPKVGKYGMLRRSYLQSHRNAYYTGMLLSGRLNAHLEKIDRQATEMVEQLTARMAREQGVTEELKASDQMKWVGLMNNIRAAAEEMALTESSMLRARRRERVRTARWIRMVMVEASFMKCGSQASSMEEILLLLLHRNRSPFL